VQQEKVSESFHFRFDVERRDIKPAYVVFTTTFAERPINESFTVVGLETTERQQVNQWKGYAAGDYDIVPVHSDKMSTNSIS
jgi:hypothetical protein